jgi:hypothetical protein
LGFHFVAFSLLIFSQNSLLAFCQVLILLIIFEDHQERPRRDREDIKKEWDNEIKNWLELNSHGNYIIEPYVTEWVVTDNTEDYYSFGNYGRVAEVQKALWPALDVLDQSENWDWNQFDADKDGKLDAVVAFHSGYGGESSGNDQYGRSDRDRIWSLAFPSSIPNLRWDSQDGSASLHGYVLMTPFGGTEGTVPIDIGLVFEKLINSMGLEVRCLYYINFQKQWWFLSSVGCTSHQVFVVTKRVSLIGLVVAKA